MEADDETTSVTMIDDEIYSNGGGGDGEEKRSKPNLSSELLDVEVYASLYSGRTKVTRLIFIADRCDNQVMKLEALRMAYEEIKKGENTNLFKEVVEKIDGKLGEEYGLDQAWVDNVDRKADVRKEKLENELNACTKTWRDAIDGNEGNDGVKEEDELNVFRINRIKERFQKIYIDFGTFYLAHGNFYDAFTKFAHAHGYSSTAEHILKMCFSAILASIEMGRFSDVDAFIRHAEKIPGLDPVTVAKLHCAAGLSLLESKKYALAAHKFIESGPELGNTYTEVIAPPDVATYGGLCALASFDRTEFKNKVIDNLNFLNFLELLVPELREIIGDFNSRYIASCLQYLENLKANLLLDIHLHDHVETLYSQIRHKALIQYTHPSVSVDLHMMADAFKTDVSGLEKELEALISSKVIEGRIDSRNKILCAGHFSETAEAAASASSIVDQCDKMVHKYAKALSAADDMSIYIQLESKIREREIQLLDVDNLLDEDKSMTIEDRRKVVGERYVIADSLRRLKAQSMALEINVKHGIRDKSKAELQDLLKEAQVSRSKAVIARSRARKAYSKEKTAKTDVNARVHLEGITKDQNSSWKDKECRGS